MSKNMDQKRAYFALERVKLISDKTEADKLKIQSANLIALIQNSGFLQAMDFAANKLKECHVNIQLWFAKPAPDGPGLSDAMRKAAKNKKLNEFLASMTNKNDYRRAMQEAVAFLGWLKSKAEGRENELAAQSQRQPDLEEV